MRKLIIFILFLTSSSVANADISTGLVGWWKFDEGSGSSAFDSSGNGNAGTLVGSPGYGAGKIGQDALSFNGSSQYVSVGNVGNIQTISYWVKAGSTTTNGGIELNPNQYIDDNAVPEGMDYNGITTTVYVDGVIQTLYGADIAINGSMESNANWTNGLNSSTCNQSSTFAHSGTYSWECVTTSAYSGVKENVTMASSTQYKATGWQYLVSGSAVSNFFTPQFVYGTNLIILNNYGSTNQWNFSYGYVTSGSTPSGSNISLESNNGAMTGYFDDISVKPVLIRYPISDTNWHLVVITISSPMSASAFTIGVVPKNGTSTYFNGDMDDVRIYNRALSAAEIAELYEYTGKGGLTRFLN